MSSENESETFPKEFEKTTEVLPFTQYGISTLEEFRGEERKLQHIESLKKAGLSNEELKLYQDHKDGALEKHNKLESSVLWSKLDRIHDKIKKFQKKCEESSKPDEQPSTSSEPECILDRLHKSPITFYPKGHPMNDLHEIEDTLFSHLKDPMLPMTKRRKLLRRLERKKQRLLSSEPVLIPTSPTSAPVRPDSLWDVREVRKQNSAAQKQVYGQEKACDIKKKLIGPKKQTMYTIKDCKIVRLEPVSSSNGGTDSFRAVEIVEPINRAEGQLLEGTKMCIDDIRKMERFKDYEPGIPSMVLYVKNIAPSVSQDQFSLLFNQFLLENRQAIDIRLLSGRMRGQAFVSFQNEDLAMRALDEVNGTIVGGRPLIVQFGRNSNRIQEEPT